MSRTQPYKRGDSSTATQIVLTVPSERKPRLLAHV